LKIPLVESHHFHNELSKTAILFFDFVNFLMILYRSISMERKLICAADWQKHHAWPPQGGLRHLIFNAKTNGFDKVVRRAGRRVLIDEAAFFAWVDEQTKQKENHHA
jgi:hypothetical protein